MEKEYSDKDAKFKRLVFKLFEPKKSSNASFTDPNYDLLNSKRNSRRNFNENNSKFNH